MSAQRPTRRSRSSSTPRRRAASHENLIKQAANLKNLKLDGLLPGVTVNTSPTDFAPIDQFQMMVFKGERWQRLGEIITAKQ